MGLYTASNGCLETAADCAQQNFHGTAGAEREVAVKQRPSSASSGIAGEWFARAAHT